MLKKKKKINSKKNLEKRIRINNKNFKCKKKIIKKQLKLYKILLFSIFLYISYSPDYISIILNNYVSKDIFKNNTNGFYSNNITNDINEIRVCVCTLGKKENRYIREYVSHYEKYGIDKIYLYDYNDINGERFEEVINDYISKGFVEILDWRGRLLEMASIMKDCYNRNYKKYN